MLLLKPCGVMVAAVAVLVLAAGAPAYAQEATPATLWDISSSGFTEFAAGLAIGPDSNPVVVGTSCGIELGTVTCSARTVKYAAATGAILWDEVDPTYQGMFVGQGRGVAIGPDGNPVTASTVCRVGATDCFMHLVKRNGANGTTLWSRVYMSGEGGEVVASMTVGPDGNPVVAGSSCQAPTDCLARAIKFSGADGAIIWSVKAGVAYQVAVGAAVDPANNVYITGADCEAQARNCNIITARLDAATGATLSTAVFDSNEGPGTITELGWAVGIGGPTGLPVVAAVTCTAATGCDFHTIKYNSVALGTPAWNVVFNSGGVNYDAGLGGGVAVAGDGHPVVVGASCTPVYPNCRGRTRKMNGTTGALLWDIVSTSTLANAAQFVAMGPDANPVLTGFDCNGVFCSFRTIKYVLQYVTPLNAAVVNINGGQSLANGVTVMFQNVQSAGVTSLVTSNTGPAPPTGWTFLGSRYFQIATTATGSGLNTICMNYTSLPIAGNEAGYRIYRRNAANTDWNNITFGVVDTVNNIICGQSDTTPLRVFAIARQ